MDFYGPFPTGETLLVVFNSYSKFPEVEIMTSTTAPCSHENLDLATHGLPKEIFSDNGPPFTSREIKQFMKERGINLRHVTPLWSQANDEAFSEGSQSCQTRAEELDRGTV